MLYSTGSMTARLFPYCRVWKVATCQQLLLRCRGYSGMALAPTALIVAIYVSCKAEKQGTSLVILAVELPKAAKTPCLVFAMLYS